MNEYFVGQILPDFIGRRDSLQIDMTDDGSFLIIALKEPTNDEIRSFINTNWEIRLTCFRYGMWFTFKFGSLDWMDAPYHPLLSNNLNIPEGLDRACAGLTIMLINSLDGRILLLDTVDYSEDFADKVSTSIIAMTKLSFDMSEYDMFLSRVKKQYSSEQIASQALGSFISYGQ